MLADALQPADRDLWSVFDENLNFAVNVDCRQAPQPYMRQEDVAYVPPRLYVFFDVIEKRGYY